MPKATKSFFDPKLFLAKVGEGKTILKFDKNHVVFSQGDAADTVFYIQKGGIKVLVVSERARKRWSESWKPDNSSEKDASTAIPCGFQQRWRSKNA
jgi:CRP-like cAMP-binding protein